MFWCLIAYVECLPQKLIRFAEALLMARRTGGEHLDPSTNSKSQP
jgi:hypothetical protein